jgi:hypothetical protein
VGLEQWIMAGLGLIPLVGFWVTWQIAKLRQENTEQHAEGRQLLRHVADRVASVDGKVEKVDEKVDKIQVWVGHHELEHETLRHY